MKYGRISVVMFCLLGCVHTAQLSPIQRRQLQMRTFEDASYDTVFRAFKTVLQDDGYVINNQDLSGGLIVAAIQKTDSNSEVWAVIGGWDNYRTGEGFLVSINLEPINDTTTETRLVIQKTEQFSQGGHQGNEILDPQMYKAFFDKVRVEIERRKAAGKT
jgi:hypothetical protein